MTTDRPVILFDGICNFCDAGVNFILEQDQKKVFRFAALQSAAGQGLLQEYGLSTDNFASFVLIENGKVYQKSSAAVKVFSHLRWYWQCMRVFWLVPKFIRDAVYDFVARNRYRWFGKKEQCRIPTAEERERFLL